MSTAVAKHTFENTESRQQVHAPLQTLTGFFFAYRFALTYLGFQSDPRAGTIVNLSCMALLCFAAAFSIVGASKQALRDLLRNTTVRWMLAYLAFSGASLLWTGADSVLDAAGLWCGMALELITLLLLVGCSDGLESSTLERIEGVFRGFVIGMIFVDAVAWLSPTLEDLRIGDYDFLHPNIIGLYSAEGFFLAQYLALRNRRWRWACLVLAMSMLRSLSKTSILAFAIAETLYLLRDRQMTRAVKMRIGLVAVGVIAGFSALFSSYLEVYATSGSGTQPETLTGRTAIWAVASLMALETPWFGHGFYSLRSLIPAFGAFEPWHAHNELLQEFFEYGVVGVIITAGIYWTLFRSVRRLAKSGVQRDGITQLAWVMVVFALIHGLTESINFGLTLPLWLIASLAAMLGCVQQGERYS